MKGRNYQKFPKVFGDTARRQQPFRAVGCNDAITEFNVQGTRWDSFSGGILWLGE